MDETEVWLEEGFLNQLNGERLLLMARLLPEKFDVLALTGSSLLSGFCIGLSNSPRGNA